MKNIFTLMLLLAGYMGFSQGGIDVRKRTIVTFPNGDESIVIMKGKQANMLSLTSTNQTNRFEELKLSNHEVVHKQELPGMNPELDSLVRIRAAYSLYREEDEQFRDSSGPGSES
jgi:hypothetical protein